jgi:hypothetical protein
MSAPKTTRRPTQRVADERYAHKITRELSEEERRGRDLIENARR